jgi:hypothetical protein
MNAACVSSHKARPRVWTEAPGVTAQVIISASSSDNLPIGGTHDAQPGA